jgi:hypothetical protein
MITTLNFRFVKKLSATTLFICHTNYDPLTFNKAVLKFEHFEIIFWIYKNITYHNFKIMNVFVCG